MNLRRITINTVACLTAVVGLMLAAPAAQADLPDVLSVAPKGATVFIGTGPLADVDQNWKKLLTAIEMEGSMPFVPTDAFGQMGVSTNSLDFSRSIGIALMSLNDEGADEPPVLMLVPVKDYAQWASAFGPDVKAEGVSEVVMSTGTPAFIRSVGTWAVMGPRKDLVETYAPQDNAVAQFKSRIGSVGTGVIERSQIFAVVDFAGLADRKQEIIEGVSQMISDSLAQMGPMAMGMPSGDEITRMNQALVGMLIDECSGVVAGMRYSERGLAIDLSLQTREGSEIGAMMPGTRTPRNLLAKFEDAPFLFAMSMDYTGVKIGSLIDTIKGRLNVAADAAGDAPGGLMPSMEIWQSTDGAASAIYPTPAWMTAGIMSRSITWFSGDSKKITAALKDSMQKMDGNETMGATVSTQYTSGAKEIGGVNADSYTVKMNAPAENMQARQALGMLYGPSGINGYIVPVEGGVFQTASPNSEVIEKAMAARKGEAASLGSNKALSAVDQMLPPSPSMRFYVGLGPIAKLIGPMAGMMMPGLDFAELGALPPIGMGASILEGGVAGSLVVPAPIIKTIAEMFQQMAGGMGGPDMGDEEPPLF